MSRSINLNPTWTVPVSIIKNEIIPRMQRDPGYLAREKIRILDGAGAEVDPKRIDWSTERAANYTLRQDSGAGNSLGSIRIDMPNKLAVYMHDTPSKRLFGADYRFLSHGCVRVQGVYDFAEWLLRRRRAAARSASGTRRRCSPRSRTARARTSSSRGPSPVIWVYLTGWANRDGAANFRNDVYGLDAGGATAIAQSAAPARRPSSADSSACRVPLRRNERRRPLQNRVDPYGELVATCARGALMGNRGGRFHRPDRTFGRRRWASRAMDLVPVRVQGPPSRVWGESYTELFFLDEPTALAAGHRPCFDCRRAEAEAFRRAFAAGARPSAPSMDAVLHRERLDKRRQAPFGTRRSTDLPDGAMIERDGRPYAVRGEAMLPWSFVGYGAPQPRPRAGARARSDAALDRARACGRLCPRWAEDLV